MESTSTPPPPPPPPSGNEPPYQRPADYYEGTGAAAPPTEKKGCPKWIPIGCGAGGCLLLLIIVIGGYFMFRDGGGGFIAKLLGPLEDQVDQMVDADVTAEQKATFKREMSQLRERLGDGSVTVLEVQPIIQEMQNATNDRRISSAELDSINELLLEANDGGTAEPQQEGEPTETTVPEGSIEL